jgi:exonuclease III
MLASPAVTASATSCVVQADVGTSDHAPVVMTTG